MIEFDQFFVGYIEQLKKKEEKIKVVKYII